MTSRVKILLPLMVILCTGFVYWRFVNANGLPSGFFLISVQDSVEIWVSDHVAKTAYEGDVVPFFVLLRNGSNEDISIVGVDVGCGCTALKPADGTPLPCNTPKYGEQLFSGAVNTANREGATIYSIKLESLTHGDIQFGITINAIKRVEVNPNQIRLSQELPKAQVSVRIHDPSIVIEDLILLPQSNAIMASWTPNVSLDRGVIELECRDFGLVGTSGLLQSSVSIATATLSPVNEIVGVVVTSSRGVKVAPSTLFYRSRETVRLVFTGESCDELEPVALPDFLQFRWIRHDPKIAIGEVEFLPSQSIPDNTLNFASKINSEFIEIPIVYLD